jgi:hypothetical protein
MEKPDYLRILKREVSKPFYTYQTFMVWTVSQQGAPYDLLIRKSLIVSFVVLSGSHCGITTWRLYGQLLFLRALSQ